MYSGSQRIARAVVSCEATASGYSARFNAVLESILGSGCELVVALECWKEAVVKFASGEGGEVGRAGLSLYCLSSGILLVDMSRRLEVADQAAGIGRLSLAWE